MVNSRSSRFTDEEMIERAFYRIAWNVKHMWEETGKSDTRLFNEPIIPDKFVIVGGTKNTREHKEHVVPRVTICKKCHEMFDNGHTVEDVAKFIRKFLKIVFISKEEQKHLDKRVGLNLRQRMPEGWEFETGCPFERLTVGKIEYELYAPSL